MSFAVVTSPGMRGSAGPIRSRWASPAYEKHVRRHPLAGESTKTVRRVARAWLVKRSRPTDEYATRHFHLAARSINAGDRAPGRYRRRDGPTTPRDVAGQLQSGGFFWLDLENPGDDELAEFGHSLQLSAGAIDSVRHAS